MAGKLTKNIRRAAIGYAIGGVTTLIAIDTLEKGKNTLTITRTDKKSPITAIALTAGLTAKPVQIEFEDGGENVCSFTDNVQFGANTYLAPTIGFKLGGLSDELKNVVEAFDLGKTTFAVKLRTGQCLLVGYHNGLKATQSNSGGGDGTANSFVGYDLVLAGGEIERAMVLSETVWNQLLALVPADEEGE